ncbi:pachytene checkpoint protein 2 homolog [Strongylocentrotus purpuratus]|uniref:Pachytene checkpoint protein 2 homolog n=1 Tax=Strongylocentrotus purpuratus TaxID=7668 RepID=A0A7M7RCW0_STRPU|nr:pachytene checkpoint protein 2 homolog [Strongylocentrotus purpuratus]|eukprot:XP_785120.1 PREDICTED: pachytene checkpoint protein 2 homolog isoform X2 [Strongylocentrotus purpuratus]
MAGVLENNGYSSGNTRVNGSVHIPAQNMAGNIGALYNIQGLEEALPEWELGYTVYVEVLQHSNSTAKTETISEHVLHLLHKLGTTVGDTKLTSFDDHFLSQHVISVAVCDTELQSGHKKTLIDFTKSKLKVSVFQLNEEGPAAEELEDEEFAAANHWLLPAAEIEGMWENLIFDSSIKLNLLNYASTTLLFSDAKIDPNIISWNRVVLLHGPPGTGKTSLCKALAQKLCIRLSDRYKYGQLVEINSHSLFSRWFSESGKLVMKMFSKIQELVSDPDSLVCILIDEVESLTSARKSALAGTEPSDAIRVVNALLTQIDIIKRNPNVLILATSNITEAIDLAFIDRADIKQYIGPPSAHAIFIIFTSCLTELMKKGVISPSQHILPLDALEAMKFKEVAVTAPSLFLLKIAKESVGLSGRTLRKLPFLAHAMFLQTSHVSLPDFLTALQQIVIKQFEERESLSKDT